MITLNLSIRVILTPLPGPLQQYSTRTVLYCTVLYCTVLYTVICLLVPSPYCTVQYGTVHLGSQEAVPFREVQSCNLPGRILGVMDVRLWVFVGNRVT